MFLLQTLVTFYRGWYQIEKLGSLSWIAHYQWAHAARRFPRAPDTPLRDVPRDDTGSTLTLVSQCDTVDLQRTGFRWTIFCPVSGLFALVTF